MLGHVFLPETIDSFAANDPKDALRQLALVAHRYLTRLGKDVNGGQLEDRTALVTRVRGTGPGVAFGDLISAVERGYPLTWETPFEGSVNVSGAALPLCDALGENRDDGFLFLRFQPATRDLPLHIHPQSDRFIFVIGGRGFFHRAPSSHMNIDRSTIVHLPARDRDAIMFRRGTVHTFSTTEHPMTLLSYHQPFVPLDALEQYTCSQPPLYPKDFLTGYRAKVSFDAAWTLVGGREGC